MATHLCSGADNVEGFVGIKGCVAADVKVGANEASSSFELNAPRDRSGTFEPQIVKKNQTNLTDDLERKIIALFALGNSYQDIRMHIEDMYGIELSNGTLNAVTDKLIPELQAWRERDLDAIYPIVWLDAIHFEGRLDAHIDL